MRQYASSLLPVLGLLNFLGIPLELQLGGGGFALELLPKPHCVVALLAPPLAEVRWTRAPSKTVRF
jgi:hypothetical protein